jgi:hypothetical protein
MSFSIGVGIAPSPLGSLEGEPLRVPPSNASLPPLLGHLAVSCDPRGIPPMEPPGFGNEAEPVPSVPPVGKPTGPPSAMGALGAIPTPLRNHIFGDISEKIFVDKKKLQSNMKSFKRIRKAFEKMRFSMPARPELCFLKLGRGG